MAMTAFRFKAGQLQRAYVVGQDDEGYQVVWRDVPQVPDTAPDEETIPRPSIESANRPPYFL